MKDYGVDLFKGAASYYSKYRPIYPASLVRFLVQEFSLNGEQTLLDLGCGTGHLTLRLADWCTKIVGIDAEAEMIEEAKRLQQEIRLGEIQWFNGRLEQYKAVYNEHFNLVTIAKAFHWMNRSVILDELYEVIPKGGGVAIIDNYEPGKSLRPWQLKLNEIIKKWYGKERKAGKQTYSHPVISHEEVISNSKFKAEVYTLPEYEINWNCESILGNLYSTSYGSKRFLGKEIDKFEKEVINALMEFSDVDQFRETVTLSVKVGRK
ncbi:class I SAM-dependent methyltransferase [Halobacillus rhizosphaerae]|uniref:class I SAM-dependent methyltransferase n=1 Tax=Halobacillus rhizosphaerae TaxID=3064889 RepID=UPI00398B13F8